MRQTPADGNEALPREPTAQGPAARVVIAHTPDDVSIREGLSSALAPLVQTGLIAAEPQSWIDGSPAPTDNADLLLVMVGPRLLAGDYVFGDELGHWLERVKRGEARVIAIALDSVSFAGTPLGGMPTVAAPQGEDRFGDVIVHLVATLNGEEPPAHIIADPEPSPDYSDDANRRLGERLQALYALRAADPTAADDDAIDAIRFKLRRGGYLKPGDFIAGGRYRLIAHAGQGRVTSVWKSWDRTDRRIVATHVLHPQWARDRKKATAYLGAAKRTIGFDHPHIAATLDSGEEDGLVYTVTAWFESGSMRKAIGGELGGVQSLQAILEVAAALQYAHARKVFHRDIRPSNIMLAADGSAHLADFDLTVNNDQADRGSVYDAPESVGPAARYTAEGEIYALGMTALHALYGRDLPFWVIRDPSRLVDSLAAADTVRQVIKKAIAWDPGDRYATVDELIEALLSDTEVVRSLGQSAVDHGRFAVAVERFRRLLQLAPADRVPILTDLGDVYSRMSAHADAFAAFQAALEAEGDGPRVESLLDRVRGLAHKTDTWAPLAATLNAQSTRRDRTHQAAMLTELASVQQHNLTDDTAAAASWQRVRDQHTTPTQGRQALQALADIAERNGDWSTYVSLNEDLLPYLDGAGRAAVAYAIGRAWQEHLGDENHALAWFETAVEGGFDASGLTENREAIRARRGEWGHVVHLMQQRAAAQATSAAVRTVLRAGHIARAVHLDADAKAIFEQLLERAPGYGRALRYLARVHHANGDAEAAMSHFERLCATFVDKKVGQPELGERVADYIAYAHLLLEGGRTDDALRRIEAARALNPNHLPTLLLAAPMHLDAGALKKARTLYLEIYSTVKSVGQHHETVAACVGLGEIEWARGRYPSAREWFNEALAGDRSCAEAWWGLAKVALVARALPDDANQTAPWLTSAPGVLTPYELLMRALAAMVPPAIMRAWLSLDPLGTVLAGEHGHVAPLAASIVDVLRRRGMIEADLFDRMAEAVPGWAGPFREIKDAFFDTHRLAEDVSTTAVLWNAGQWDDFATHRPRPLLATALSAPPLRAPTTRQSSTKAFKDLFRRSTKSIAPPAGLPREPTAEVPTERGPVIGLSGSDGSFTPIHPDSGISVGSDAACDLRHDALQPTHFHIFRAGPNLYLAAEAGTDVVVNGRSVTEARIAMGHTLAVNGWRATVADGATEPEPMTMDEPAPPESDAPMPTAVPDEEVEASDASASEDGPPVEPDEAAGADEGPAGEPSLFDVLDAPTTRMAVGVHEDASTAEAEPPVRRIDSELETTVIAAGPMPAVDPEGVAEDPNAAAAPTASPDDQLEGSPAEHGATASPDHSGDEPGPAEATSDALDPPEPHASVGASTPEPSVLEPPAPLQLADAPEPPVNMTVGAHVSPPVQQDQVPGAEDSVVDDPLAALADYDAGPPSDPFIDDADERWKTPEPESEEEPAVTEAQAPEAPEPLSIERVNETAPIPPALADLIPEAGTPGLPTTDPSAPSLSEPPVRQRNVTGRQAAPQEEPPRPRDLPVPDFSFDADEEPTVAQPLQASPTTQQPEPTPEATQQEPPPSPRAHLVWKEGSMEAVVDFNKYQLTIGTHHDDDIVLHKAPEEVPRTLYRLYRQGTEFYAHDARPSPPGPPRRLRQGELFTIGNQLFRLHIDEAAQAFDVPQMDDEPPSPEPLVTPIGTIVVKSGASRGVSLAVKDRVMVGGGDSCDIQIDGDRMLSGSHFEVVQDRGSYRLLDAGSDRGTIVNGKRVQELKLTGGEVIMAGTTVFSFTLD